MTDTFSSSVARSAVPQAAIASGRAERIVAEITQAPETQEQEGRSTQTRDQQSQEARAIRADDVRVSDDVIVRGGPHNIDDRQERAIRGEVRSVSAEGAIVVSTSEGQFELQVSDLRAAQRLQVEAARRSVEIVLVLSTLSPNTTNPSVSNAAEIVVLPSVENPVQPLSVQSSDTPVAVQISSDSLQPLVEADVDLPLLNLTGTSVLPDQAIRLESVLGADVESLIVLPVVAEITSRLATFLPADSLPGPVADFSLVAPLEASSPVLNSPPDISVVSIPFNETIAFSSPLPVEEFYIPSPQLSAVLPPQNHVSVFQTGLASLPSDALPVVLADGVDTALISGLESPYIRLEGVQSLVPDPSFALDPFALAENPILKNVPAIFTTVTVVGQTAEKLPVVALTNNVPNSEDTFFILHRPASSLIVGADIHFLPLSQPSSDISVADALSANAQSALPTLPALITPAPWPVFNEALQGLQISVPHVAQALANITPSPAVPGQLTPAALFFLAAVGSGDISNLLGQRHIETLRRAGQSGLVDRLGQEIQGLARLSSEPVSQDWRVIMLPLLWEQEIHKAVIHWREDGSDEEEGSKGEQTRFVMDLALDGMGDVQVDALFRPGRLDTIVRTEQPFSEVMHAEMRRLYTDGLKLSAMGGELSFQSEPEQWVKILPRHAGAEVRV